MFNLPLLRPALCVSPQSSTPSFPSPIVWYQLNGNPNDLSGNNNTATLNNGYTFGSGDNGFECLNLDGSSQYMNCGNILNFTTESFSVSTWISASNFTSTPVLFSNGTYGNVGYFAVIQPTGQVQFFTAYEGNGIITQTNIGAVMTGSWYNITYTVNLSGLVNIYINGVQSATTQPTNNATPSSTLPFCIGVFKVGEDTPTQYFAGSIQDFRVYQGILTGAQVSTIYSTGPQATTPANLVAWYKLNGDTTDATGGVNGTLVGSPTFVSGDNGFQCLSLNGTSQYLDAGSLTYSPAVTYTAWINVNSYTAIGWTYQGIIVKSNATGYCEYFVKSNGKLACYSTVVGGGAINYDGTGTHTLATGTWYFVCMTMDSVNGINGYVNGTLDGSAGGSLAISNFTNDTWIGTDNQAGERFFDGKIQDARIYNVALTSTQISTLYSAGPQ